MVPRISHLVITLCTPQDALTQAVVAATQAALATQATLGTPSQPSHRLPRLDLPKFSGDVLKWPEFWDLFQSSVHVRPLPDVDKLSYLKISMQGEAAQTITGLPITSGNYQVALSMLQDKYGRPEVITSTLYSKLQNLSAASTKFSDLLTLHTDLESLLRQLCAAGEDVDSQYSLIPQLRAKFPLSVTAKLEEWKASTGTASWTVKSFRTALQTLLRPHTERCTRSNIGKAHENG